MEGLEGLEEGLEVSSETIRRPYMFLRRVS